MPLGKAKEEHLISRSLNYNLEKIEKIENTTSKNTLKSRKTETTPLISIYFYSTT